MNKSLGIYNLIDKNGINRSITNVIKSNIDFNAYTTPKGLKELRIEIGTFLHRLWGYNINYKNMLITSGSQQSINLISNSLINEGDTIFVEQPTYFGALDVFKKKNIKLVGIDLYEDGLNLEMLEKEIIKHPPKLIYVTPTFNNPTGYAWTNKNRKGFLHIINKYNILVLEDDPYSLINFTNHKYNSLYKLNNGKNIIYLGTFSKLISPSVNVGYIISDEKYIDKIYFSKKIFDLCTSAFLQYVVLDYLKHNNLEEIISDKVIIYKKFLDESIKELNKSYKNQIDYFSNPKGGLFLLVKFKDRINEDEFEDGSNYYIDGQHNNITRINICNMCN